MFLTADMSTDLSVEGAFDELAPRLKNPLFFNAVAVVSEPSLMLVFPAFDASLSFKML